MNEQAVVTSLNEHVLLVSEKTQISMQFIAGCKLFPAAPFTSKKGVPYA